MRKPQRTDTTALATPSARLTNAGKLIAHQHQLRKNAHKIASPYILLLSCTLLPLAIYFIARIYSQLNFVIDFQTTQDAMERAFFSHDQHTLATQLAEQSYQTAVINDWRFALLPAVAEVMETYGVGKIATYRDFLIQHVAKLEDNEKFLSDFAKILDAIQREIAYHFGISGDNSPTKENIFCEPVPKEFTSSRQQACWSIENDLYEVSHNNSITLGHLIKFSYQTLFGHIQKFLELLPRDPDKKGYFQSVYIDMRTRTLDLSKLKKMPTLLRLVTTVLTVRGEAESLKSSFAKKISHIEEHIQRIMVNNYCIFPAIGFSAIAYRLLVTPILRSIFPLQYWTSHTASEASSIDMLSMQHLEQLTKELQLAIVDTQEIAQRNDSYTKMIYAIIFIIAATQTFYHDSFPVLNLLIFSSAAGLMLEKIFDYGLSAAHETQLDSNLKQCADSLRSLFPSVEISCHKKETLYESSLLLLVKGSVKPLSKLEYINLLLFTLSKFNIMVLAVSIKEWEILISASQKIPSVKIKAFLQTLLKEIAQIKEIEESVKSNLKIFDLGKYCSCRVSYDDNHLPSLQLTSTNPGEATQKFLESNKFVEVSEKYFILRTTGPLRNDFFTQFNQAVLEDKEKSISQTKTNAETPQTVKRPKTSIFSTYIAAEKKHEPEKIYTWHNVGDKKTLSSQDPKVMRIENGAFPMYLFFRVDEESLPENVCKKLYEKSVCIAGAKKNCQGIKFYSEKILPGGAVARVKLLGEHADTTVYIYRHEEADPNMPTLLCTDDKPTFSCHNILRRLAGS